MSKMDDYIIDELNELNEEQEGKPDRIKEFVGEITEEDITNFPLEEVERMGCDPLWADLIDPSQDGKFAINPNAKTGGQLLAHMNYEKRKTKVGRK